MLHIIALIIAAPTFTVGYAFVGLVCALGLARNPRIGPRAIAVATWRPWVAKHWRYSTTVGRGVVLHPDHEEKAAVWDHERVHVRQSEDLCALGLVLGIVANAAWGDWAQALLVWHVAPVGLLLNYVMAGLRHGKLAVYREAEHERAAYSQARD